MERLIRLSNETRGRKFKFKFYPQEPLPYREAGLRFRHVGAMFV